MPASLGAGQRQNRCVHSHGRRPRSYYCVVMVHAAGSRAMFARSHRLDGGLSVRVRLARPGDQPLVADLLERLGFQPSQSLLLDVMRFDPRRRAVVCATALIGGTERVVGFRAVDLQSSGAPATVVAEPEHGGELTRLVRSGLRARAQLATRA